MNKWHIIGILLLVSLFGAVSCSRQKSPTPASLSSATTSGKTPYVIMEKVLADAQDRPRTTMKVLISGAKPENEIRKALVSALNNAKADDPALKAVIIWAYNDREELNGSNFTAGKLEWSADGKDFAGFAPLVPNPKIDVISQ